MDLSSSSQTVSFFFSCSAVHCRLALLCPCHSLREDRSADNWIFNTLVSVVILSEESCALLHVPQVVLLIIYYGKSGVKLFASLFLSAWIWFQKVIADRDSAAVDFVAASGNIEYTLPYTLWNAKSRMHSFYCDFFFRGWGGVFSEQAYLKAMIVVFSKVLSVIFNYKSSILEGFVVRRQLRAHMIISHFFLSSLFSLSPVNYPGVIPLA